MEPMQARTRYVVAVKGLVDSEGVILPAPEGFRRLRDKQALGVAEWDSLAERYESSVFPVLETAGLDRSDLQLAWDFTTGSDEQLTDDMFAIRDLALEWTQNNDPVVSIRDVIERDEEDAPGQLFEAISKVHSTWKDTQALQSIAMSWVSWSNGTAFASGGHSSSLNQSL